MKKFPIFLELDGQIVLNIKNEKQLEAVEAILNVSKLMTQELTEQKSDLLIQEIKNYALSNK